MWNEIKNTRQAALMFLLGVVIPDISCKILSEMTGADSDDRKMLGRSVKQVENSVRRRFERVATIEDLDNLKSGACSEESLEQRIRTTYLFMSMTALKPLLRDLTRPIRTEDARPQEDPEADVAAVVDVIRSSFELANSELNAI